MPLESRTSSVNDYLPWAFCYMESGQKGVCETSDIIERSLTKETKEILGVLLVIYFVCTNFGTNL